jgi:hypothetical protein
MDENPFARCDRRESDSYYLASWIFSQIFLVVEHKTAFFAKKKCTSALTEVHA